MRTPLNSRARGAPHIAQACDAVHATTYQHHRSSRSPDHPQPSCSEGVAQRHEHQPGEQHAVQSRMATPHASRATSARPRQHSRSRKAAQPQSPMRSFAFSPLPMVAPTSMSPWQRAVDMITTMTLSLTQRVTSFALPVRRPRATPEHPRARQNFGGFTPELCSSRQRHAAVKSQIWELTQSDARGTQSNAKVTPKPPSRRPAGPLTSLPPPSRGGCAGPPS